ncbi:hypothetical protein FHS29_007333 [Saccharothrix tamanrassetensis]|uniref:Uncharacterized protein n=1 Tax=Saccharothrix tamanrassetensis TaxID=1051531 RepID=A0A841CXN4_9PSEU|nr:hypothetical protein [Saccharothrix tamanrassetensis]MBB5960705.1 hypothetical protein [Saccharothrix tamanrassetensis]
MYKRVVMIVAGALFGLLALVATIVTDILDRDFPQALSAQTRIGVDLNKSQLTDKEVLGKLTELDARWNLGLVKIAPDLAGDRDQRVFATLNDRDLPATFSWFGGDGAGRVVGKDRLTNSPPDGTYLVTGESARIGELEGALGDVGVRVTRTDASVTSSLEFVMKEGSFGAAILAAFALIATLALFWLSMKARSRALRVLGGCPTARIQLQDLGGFAGVLLLSAAMVTIAAAVYVGASRGWLYVSPFLKSLIGLESAVIAVSLLAALAMSASAWPSATMLATRQPAVRSLRTAAIVVQALTFVLVVSAAGPAWSAYQNSSAAAAETAQWKQLADQVAITFGMSDQEMTAVEPQIGKLVQHAESHDEAAFSYTFTESAFQADFGQYSAVSFVNQRWLDLMTGAAQPQALTPVPSDRVQDLMRSSSLGEQFAIMSRRQDPSGELPSTFTYLQPTAGFRLPVSEGGSGQSLQFLSDVLIAVVPSVHDAFNDSNLTSMMSTGNVVFTGAANAQHLLERTGLSTQALREQGFKGELGVVYIAEEGILRAQFTAYVVWLMNLALIALFVAFAVAAVVSALITSLLQAKRDFPLRLSGRSWARILQSRVARELGAGVVLVFVVLLFQGISSAGPVLLAGVCGFIVIPLSHVFTARWCFAGVGKRRI